MALDKAGLQSAFQSIFEDLGTGKTAAQAATELSDAIDVYVKTAIATVTIPSGTVITAVTGGGGAPAVGIPNAAPISLVGDPDDVGGQNAGGLS